ncbi:MAG TPA: EthD domain-containing protein [Caulobacteraceae bacterium]|jgi:uncharacterized protein (TIGR02118 family)
MPLKIVFCLRRKEGISREEFQRYWLEEHAPRVKGHAAAIGMRRYVQSHALDTPLNDAVAGARGAPEPYDGVMEGWWDSEEALLATLSSPEAQAAGRDLLEDEARFIDLACSPIFFTREHVIFE